MTDECSGSPRMTVGREHRDEDGEEEINVDQVDDINIKEEDDDEVILVFNNTSNTSH